MPNESSGRSTQYDSLKGSLKGKDLNYGTVLRTPPNEADEAQGDSTDALPTESTSLTEEEYIYPEGGLESWLVVLGAWCSLSGGLGILNAFGPLQTYVSENQLAHIPGSKVAWIFSTNIFLALFCSLQVGPLFDAFGPRLLVAAGTVSLVLSMMLIGFCTEYWHFILDFSVLGGLGASLLLTPALATVGHYFERRRAFATGLAMTGPSFGGVVFPLIFRATFPTVGFAWGTRILGFVMLFLLTISNVFLRSRLPRKKPSPREILPDLKIFLDGTGAFALATAGFFLMEFSLFIPLAYLVSYCEAHDLGEAFGFQLVAILNAASFVGRALPGFVADKVGRYNTNVVMLLLCMITPLAVWLPAASTSSVSTCTLVFAVLFGVASGSNLGLIGPCIGQLCETHEYGRYFATSYAMVSIATLVGIPIAGELIEATGGEYWALIVLVGVGYGGAMICMAAVRIIKVGWGLKEIF